jgi:(2Fe-2S) ferredoxin
MVKFIESSRQILVCQSRSCRKQGAAAVLAAFQALPVTNVKVVGSSCLGQCGCGPMVLVTPEQIWYSGVHASEVFAVVERHLKSGHPVVSMLYPKYHRSIRQS